MHLSLAVHVPGRPRDAVVPITGHGLYPQHVYQVERPGFSAVTVLSLVSPRSCRSGFTPGCPFPFFLATIQPQPADYDTPYQTDEFSEHYSTLNITLVLSPVDVLVDVQVIQVSL